jgi:hypothetical protein
MPSQTRSTGEARVFKVEPVNDEGINMVPDTTSDMLVFIAGMIVVGLNDLPR